MVAQSFIFAMQSFIRKWLLSFSADRCFACGLPVSCTRKHYAHGGRELRRKGKREICHSPTHPLLMATSCNSIRHEPPTLTAYALNVSLYKVHLSQPTDHRLKVCKVAVDSNIGGQRLIVRGFSVVLGGFFCSIIYDTKRTREWRWICNKQLPFLRFPGPPYACQRRMEMLSSNLIKLNRSSEN